MWFDGDQRKTTYKDRLEEWNDFFVPPSDYNSEFEGDFQAVEMAAGIRKKASIAKSRTRRAKDDSPPPSEYSGSDLGGDDDESDELNVGVREVDSWESDLEDDEADDEPNDVDNGQQAWNVDVDLCRARWEDVGVLRVDPRSKTGSRA